MPAGALGKDFSSNTSIAPKGPTYSEGRKRTEKEIEENDKKLKEWKFDMKASIEKSKMGDVVSANNTVLLSHLDSKNCQKAVIRLREKKSKKTQDYIAIALNLIEVYLTLIECDVVHSSNLTADHLIRIYQKQS